MVGNEPSQTAALVSPKNKLTPFAEFEIVKTAGTCWGSSPGPRGKPCSMILVLSPVLEEGSVLKIIGAMYLLVIV